MITSLTFQILLALADGDRHGYGIIKEIEEREGEGSAPSTGALYLALQRMEREGLIVETASPSGEDPRRHYYRITDRGRAGARGESARMARLVNAAQRKKLLTERA